MIGLDQCWCYLGLLLQRVRQNRVAPGYLLIKGPRFVPGFDALQYYSPVYTLNARPSSDYPTQGGNERVIRQREGKSVHG
jgi:hypothetical protein